MKTIVKVAVLFVLGILVIWSVQSEQIQKPRITGFSFVPSEPIQPSGDCTSSTGGYYDFVGKAPTDRELGDAIVSDLKHGYIVTVYPLAASPTKRGVFANLLCTNTMVRKP